MKLPKFKSGGQEKIGIVHTDDTLLFDLATAANRSGSANPAFASMLALIDAGDAELDAVVDATENKQLFWASAAETLAMAEEGKVMIIFPTRRNLERLALFDSFEAAAAHASEFPVRTVLTYIDEQPDGKFLSIPDGHGYPVIAEPLGQSMRG